eukprot:641011-Rhodomonas_salina.1
MAKKLAQLCSGDRSLYPEIEAAAASNSVEANMARSSLGMSLGPQQLMGPQQPVIDDDALDRRVKRR